MTKARPKVAILKVPDYQEDRVREAVARGLKLLQVEEDFFKGKSVLLKPNLLMSFNTEKGVCSEPAVVAAMAAVSQGLGGDVCVGDSPAFESVHRVASVSGITRALRGMQVPLIPFDAKVDAKFQGGKICKSFPLAAVVLEKDVLVSVARLKTHSLTGYSGAVKNLYGCIVGHNKATLHHRYSDIHAFGKLLADLAGLIQPALSLVDGIISMEGPGPSRGTPRKTGFMVMSRDPVAADAVACRLVGIDIKDILHLKYAAEAGYGCADVNSMELLGDSLEGLMVKGFKKAPSHRHSARLIPGPLARVFMDYYLPFPLVHADKCKGCKICAGHCPPGIITVDATPEIDYSKCIRCYCCQELCPHGAVTLKRRLHRRSPSSSQKNSSKGGPKD
jgi:uncharacterized protein (DUF362 family)/NAD-dependent dihydropyrimidine dehydrogenase PreA subunit